MEGQVVEGRRLRKRLGLVGVFLGIVIFAAGIALLNVFALAGIALSAGSAAYLTMLTGGRRMAVDGMMTGLVGAAVSWMAMRSMMRWVALSSGATPLLTFEGTANILLTSILLSVLPAMGYVHFRRRFGHSFQRSFLYGLLLAGAGGIPFVFALLGEINSIAKVPIIPVSFLLVVPVVFALTLEASHRVLPKLRLTRK